MTDPPDSAPSENRRESLPKTGVGDLVIDNKLFGNKSIQITDSESQEERDFRLRESEKDAQLERFKDRSLFVTALVFTVVLAVTCLLIILGSNYSSETKGWAQSVIFLVAGGFLGYLTGRQSRGV